MNTKTNQNDPEAQEAALLLAVRDFMRLESAGGILLLGAAILAILMANSPLASIYGGLLDTTVAIQVGTLAINKPLVLWINDGLMAIFFFLIGLEIKREVLEGELSSFSQVVLPGAGALGGMVVPAAIYAWFNWGNASAMDGWAIPVATDIAFALALLSVFGSRVPTSLKVFLLTLAIFDDLAAIVIIAIFYSGDLSLTALYIGIGAILIAAVMNRLHLLMSFLNHQKTLHLLLKKTPKCLGLLFSNFLLKLAEFSYLQLFQLTLHIFVLINLSLKPPKSQMSKISAQP